MTAADDQIAQAILDGRSFVLDAGAGSGKTASLVKALTLLRNDYRTELLKKRQQVACITYTNVAKDEIIERIERDELFRVSTIHDFLWDLIKPYQSELKKAVQKFNTELPESSTRKKAIDDLQHALGNIERIIYSDRGSNFLEGRIFHDDLIGIAAIMFEEYPLLPRLVGLQYPFILVDEYQDTFVEVIEILLDRIRAHSHHLVVGFFGDKVQAIYDNVVGEIPETYDEILTRITKVENYRCAITVIDLLNRFRTDIQQVPAGDNVKGAAIYVGYSAGGDSGPEEAYEIASKLLIDPPPFADAKVLYLTHRLIARKAGFSDLSDVYRKLGGYSRDQFQSGEDPVACFLAYEVDCLASSWAQNDKGSALTILERNRYSFENFTQKQAISDALDNLVILINEGGKLGAILSHIDQNNLMRFPYYLSDGLALASVAEADIEDDKKRRWEMFRALINVDALQIRNYRKFLEDNSPFTTKHGVKGDEFETVVVVLDDSGARWTKYSFGNLLKGSDKIESRLKRTTNLFYVCCSRAKKNLIVIDLDYTADRKPQVETLFGPDNVIFV